MNGILDSVETIVVVIMENRSFDHMLGYLSHPAYGKRPGVDGQSADAVWLARYTNTAHGLASAPFHWQQLNPSGDPPHERNDVRVQIGAPYPWGPSAPMTGFMLSYSSNPRVPSDAWREVMGFYTPAEAPITAFFADHFTVCDHWFACLPASTQPNRLMAMSGFAMTDNTSSSTVPDQELVYDWCERQPQPVRWRVYHEGWPFFMVMNKWRHTILEDAFTQDKFCDLDRLEADFSAGDPFPQLIFVEPKYTDDHFSSPAPSDDHPPTSIAGGQAFLRRVYTALTKNQERWRRTVMIVTYDENGGFFDHVSPLALPTPVPPGASYNPFVTTGVRVPAFVISPLVRAGSLYQKPLDHTSILRFIGDKFGAEGRYSAAVNGRAVVGSVTDVLESCREPVPLAVAPAAPDCQDDPFSHAPVDRVATPTSLAFENALVTMRAENPQAAAQKFPELKDYFAAPSGELWALAERELSNRGLTLAPELAPAFEGFVAQAEMRLQKDPVRDYLATANMTQFVNRMVSEAHGATVLTTADFEIAQRAMPWWPFR